MLHKHKRIQVAALSIALLLLVGPSSQAQTLTILGSNGFTVDTGNTGVPFSQGPLALTINGAIVGGSSNILAGTFTQAYDWSAVSAFGLTMSISGSNPNLSFTLELVDGDFATQGTFTGSTGDWGSVSSLVALDEVSRGVLTNVIGMNFTFDTDGTINMTMDNISVVPEPTTWAMLTFGAMLFGGLALRRRLSAVRR